MIKIIKDESEIQAFLNWKKKLDENSSKMSYNEYMEELEKKVFTLAEIEVPKVTH